ncbi:MAG TPA: ADP/ATP-dependent (S)-NAD(P)H-hydrate dehydratase [Thermomicrobiales bacterium]|nr:ADP/ATP-dependent (S)-NAD(P)H-hydrate dehydratase [Thermomicrobiales bacterium]
MDRRDTPGPKLGANEQLIDEALVRPLVPKRGFGAHKWGVGGLVIVAGSPGFAGAAVLSAMAAGRAGAGIVNLACARSVAAIAVEVVPETATIPLADSEAAAGGKRAIDRIGKKLEKSAALLIGPGLGEDEATAALMEALFGSERARHSIGFGIGSAAAPEPKKLDGGLVAACGKPVAIDADGLNWLAKQTGWSAWLPPQRVVLTPHVGEMARLLDVAPAAIVDEPLATVRDAAKAWNQIVVLKYGYTAVSDGTTTLVADDAPVSLATAGSGDVFAGTIAALLAQGLAPLDAAALAIYVGMRAARRVERRTGVLGLVASDLPPAIAHELGRLDGTARDVDD